jgi:histidine triad (HIT) family protein
VTEDRAAADCIFCKIVAGQVPASKVYETDSVLAFHDLSPKAPTHILIIPKKHIPGMADLQAEDAPLMGELALAARDIAAQQGVTDDFRLVTNNGASAGQSVFHLHWHLLAGRRMGWPPG